jgi:hypothetical protein
MSDCWNSLDEPVLKEMRAGSNLLFQFDVSSLIIPAWTTNRGVSAAQLIRPTQPNQNGYWYQAGAAGQTGGTEPGWATTGTTQDGSITWTPVAPPGTGQDSIASVQYVQQSPPDAALIITASGNTQRVAAAYWGGGTSGQVYTVNVQITMASGAIYIPQVMLTVL